MKALIKTTNHTVPSMVINLLEQAGIKAFEFDQNVSVMEGSIGIFPRRIMVAEEDYERARKLVIEAGLEHELETEKKR